MADTHAGEVTKAASFKKEQNITLSIAAPSDVPVPTPEPDVQPLETPTVAQVDADFEKELQQLQQ